MVSASVGEVVAHGPLETDTDVVVLVEGCFQLSRGEVVFFEEASFPLTELVVAMRRWSTAGGLESRTDFEFDSMSAEEPGLLWFRAVPGGWRVGSIWQDEPCLQVLSSEALLALVAAIGRDVRSELERTQGVVAAELLDVAIERVGERAQSDG